jgi:hypothetical protein
VSGLADMLGQLLPPAEGVGWLRPERLEIDMPFELRVGAGDDGLVLEASAPTQVFRTTVMPTFHRIQIHLEVER